MSKKKIVISRTPLRITFVGGGTDMPAYYKKYGTGALVNAAINKYVYINVHSRFDKKIRVSYSKTELVDSVAELEHPAVREALKMLGIKEGIEIYHMADVPSGGTGMGSSSSFLVGLLNALHVWKGEDVSATKLAEEAVKIEREILKEPGGRQDQYIAALGDIQFMEFEKNDKVKCTRIRMDKSARNSLQSHLLMLYTGTEKSQAGVHDRMEKRVEQNLKEYGKMADLGRMMFDDLSKNRWQSAGKYMHENWLLKKVTHGLDNQGIDDYYNRGLKAGAEGGKVLGAGNRGFFLFFAPPDRHDAIRKELSELRPEPFEFSEKGTEIIYTEG